MSGGEAQRNPRKGSSGAFPGPIGADARQRQGGVPHKPGDWGTAVPAPVCGGPPMKLAVVVRKAAAEAIQRLVDATTSVGELLLWENWIRHKARVNKAE